MSADPATSGAQPDVYEDVGDPDPPLTQKFPPRPEIDGIEEENVDPTQAFEVFAGKKFATKKGHGLVRAQQEYGIAPATSRSNESPLERLHRLVAEVDTFTAEVEQLKSQAAEDKDASVVDSAVQPDELARELGALKAQLSQVLAETGEGGPHAGLLEQHKVSSTGASNTSSKQLIARLDALSTASAQGGSDSAADSAPTYELYLGAGSAKSGTGLSGLEARVAALEAATGAVTAGEGSGAALCQTMAELEARVTLLDGPRLDQLSRKAATASVHLDALIKQAGALPESQERDEQIKQVYKTLQEWDPTMQQLPVIVSRLRALKQLHSAAGGLTATLTQLESEQSKLQGVLSGNSKAVEQLQANLVENMASIKDNVLQLEERISKLK